MKEIIHNYESHHDTEIDHYLHDLTSLTLRNIYDVLKDWVPSEGKPATLKNAVQQNYKSLGNSDAAALNAITIYNNDRLANYPFDRFIQKVEALLEAQETVSDTGGI